MAPREGDRAGGLHSSGGSETDGWDDITLTLATERPVTRVRRVGENGSWKSCRATVRRFDAGNVRIDIAEGLEYMDFTAFVIE